MPSVNQFEYLLIKVFIVYGGRKGEELGKKIDDHLKIRKYDSFLASPKAHNIPRGENFQPHIDRELENTDIAVIVVRSGIRSSTPAKTEIEQIKNLNIPHIPYVEDQTKPPDSIKDEWQLSFPKNKGHYKSNLMNLEIEIWKRLYRKLVSEPKESEELSSIEPEKIPIGVIYK